MAPSGRLRLAAIGCGAVFRHHVDAIKKFMLPIDIAAVVDVDRRAADVFARELGCPAFGNLQEAASQASFDAVSIAVPHDRHVQVALDTFKLGRHVLLEKPMARTLTESRRILRAAEELRKAGEVFMLAENSQYWPEVTMARDLLKQGAIGDLVTAEAHYFEAESTSPFGSTDGADDAATYLGWRASLKRCGGGIVIDGGQHWIRPLRIWMGEVVDVVGVTHNLLPGLEGESLAHAILRFESGKTACYRAMFMGRTARLANNAAPWFRLTGTKGEIIVNGDFSGGLRLYDAKSPEGRSMIPTGGPQGFLDSFGFELADFVKATMEGGTLQATPEYALGDLAVALAIYRSARERRWVRMRARH